MAHGYLGDGYGSHGEIGSDRDDGERDWRGRDRDWSDRNRDRGFIFGNRDRGESRYGPEHGYGGFQGDYSGRSEQGGFGGSGDYAHGRRSFSAHPDDHYRSWRDRQIQALDRDYEDYCREREQQFHQDFDQWRRQKSGNSQPLRTGMTQTGPSHDPSGMTQSDEDNTVPTSAESDAAATATLGTNSGAGGRGRR